MKKARRMKKVRRYKHGLPLSEWTLKEIEESLEYVKAFVEKHPKSNDGFSDLLGKLLVARSERIGKK